MRRVDRLAAALGIVAVALASCGLAGFGGDTIATPAGMPEPIGPIVEIGRGEQEGLEWRYSIYESDVGTCTRLESVGGGSGDSCGMAGIGLAAGPTKITIASVGTGTNMPTQIEGFATDDVAEVWIETDQGPVAAAVMTLGIVDMDGQAFVAFVPSGRQVGDVYALDADRMEIGRESVDLPPTP